MDAIDLLSDEEIISDLPESVLAIAELVSLNAAKKLISGYGGTYFSVPMKYRANHDLNELLGKHDFEKLIYHYRGEEIEIPICQKIRSKLFSLQLKKERQEGLSVKEIARKNKLSVRTVSKRLNT